jgi:hypothetical protein
LTGTLFFAEATQKWHHLLDEVGEETWAPFEPTIDRRLFMCCLMFVPQKHCEHMTRKSVPTEVLNHSAGILLTLEKLAKMSGIKKLF